MPRGDGTGPAGMGPMTGRAAGFCAGYSVPGYMSHAPGRGRAWRRGLGGVRPRPYRGQYATAPGAPNYGPNQGYYGQQPYQQDPEEARKQELEYLKNTEKAIEEELNAVKKRIKVIENNPEE